MNEFQLIEKYFQDLLPDNTTTTLGIGDDAALIAPKLDQELAISVDTLVENRHFYSDEKPDVIAHKALAVNLSDMAAMGAEPTGFLLALTLPKIDKAWLESFSQGLKDVAQQYKLSLLGGDTTKGPLNISITILGNVPKGQALTRKGAKAGEFVFVSGTLGAAAYQKPTPQIELGLALRGIATSCIDISDGLAQDCQHILQQSNCGACINVEALPIHPEVLQNMPEQEAQQLALTGGDDYQLLFTAPANAKTKIKELAQQLQVSITKIGEITTDNALILNLNGNRLDWNLQGWDHFL